jgi:hypothetical protein
MIEFREANKHHIEWANCFIGYLKAVCSGNMSFFENCRLLFENNNNNNNETHTLFRFPSQHKNLTSLYSTHTHSSPHTLSNGTQRG